MPESTDNSKRSIVVGDQPATQDSLGFTPYVVAIAECLISSETTPPLALSIEAEWGSGKSSFMKQLEQEILRQSEELHISKIEEKKKQIFSKIKWKQIHQQLWQIGPNTVNNIKLSFRLIFQQRTQTIWFNAWRHDKAESLWAAFALLFLEQISKNRNYCDIFPNLYSHWLLFVSRVDLKKNWLEILQKIAIFSFLAVIAVTIPYYYLTTGKDQLETFSQKVVCQYRKEFEGIDKEQQKQQCPENRGLNILLFLMGGGGSFSATFTLLAKLRSLIGDYRLDLREYLESPNYENQVAFIEKFHQDFEKIVRAYVGKDEKVYVFIDDLDRCELSKSADLLQALNLMISNDPNIIFILGMDREKVAAGITYKQKDILPYLYSISGDYQELGKDDKHQLMKQLDYGFSFMDKFVQLTFSIPQPSKDALHDFVLNKQEESDSQISKIRKNRSLIKILQKICKKLIFFITKYKRLEIGNKTVESPKESSKKNPKKYIYPIIKKKNLDADYSDDFLEMIITFFDYNPRSLRRYFNILRLRQNIAYYAIAITWDEVKTHSLTIEQLGKFIAITLKYPHLFSSRNKYDERLELLKKLEEYAYSLSSSSKYSYNCQEEIKEYVDRDSKLKDLLVYGLKDDDNRYSLVKNQGIKKLLEVSPKLELNPRYFKLRSYLENRNWEKADEETTFGIIFVVKKGDRSNFDESQLQGISAEDLLTIDDLWRKYSENQFGFTWQKEIYREISQYPGNNEESIREEAKKIGWLQGEERRGYYPFGAWLGNSFEPFFASVSGKQMRLQALAQRLVPLL